MRKVLNRIQDQGETAPSQKKSGSMIEDSGNPHTVDENKMTKHQMQVKAQVDREFRRLSEPKQKGWEKLQAWCDFAKRKGYEWA